MCDKPMQQAADPLNMVDGLVDRKTRGTVKVVVPTVYSKDKWAQRRLGDSELGHAMDYPGDKIKKLLPTQLQKLLAAPVPGKSLAIAIASLTLTLEGGASMTAESKFKRKLEQKDALPKKQSKHFHEVTTD
jgi:hypothetical protein